MLGCYLPSLCHYKILSIFFHFLCLYFSSHLCNYTLLVLFSCHCFSDLCLFPTILTWYISGFSLHSAKLFNCLETSWVSYNSSTLDINYLVQVPQDCLQFRCKSQYWDCRVSTLLSNLTIMSGIPIPALPIWSWSIWWNIQKTVYFQ